MQAVPRKRSLFLGLDAFGTLFKPKVPVAQQYGEVARSCGLADIGADHIEQSFKKAYKKESAAHPNYGHKSGLTPSEWWANIIRGTFTPLLKPGQSLPDRLVSDLLTRFSTKEGYALTNGASEVFNSLAEHRAGKSANGQWSQWETVFVGVISNSDDRIIPVLQSSGIKARERRFQMQDPEPSKDDDITSFILSYDVGYEKPDKHIFDIAANMFRQDLESGRYKTILGRGVEIKDFDFLYVGDDVAKDFDGARRAGWHSVLFDPDHPFNAEFEENKHGIITSTQGSPSPIIQSLLALRYWGPVPRSCEANQTHG